MGKIQGLSEPMRKGSVAVARSGGQAHLLHSASPFRGPNGSTVALKPEPLQQSPPTQPKTATAIELMTWPVSHFR